MLSSSQMAIQLMLLLISCSLYRMSSSYFSTSSSLALLLLVISLLFSNPRQLIKTSSHNTKPLYSMEEAVDHQDSIRDVPQDAVAGDEPEDLTGDLSDCSDCPVVTGECTEEESSVPDSDDESLIEISIADGHYVVGQCEECPWKKEQDDLLADFLPDLVLDKRDFMDILAEISEEENLIEIDIARGSIKCANFGIKA